MQEILLFTRVCNTEPLKQPSKPRGSGKINMNLESIYRLIEETQIFGMQQSVVKARPDVGAPASGPRDTCSSCWPLTGLQSHAAHSFCAHGCSASEWDICEELRLRELEEVKARAAQMEKTMRWWSDCTANWREKWSKVRAERNSAREEGRQLRMELEMTVKELSALKKKQSSPHPKETLEARVALDQTRPGFINVSCVQRDQLQSGSQMCESIGECLVKREFPTMENRNTVEEGLILDPLRLNEEKLHLDCSDLFENSGSGNCAMRPGLRQPVGHLSLEDGMLKVSTLQEHLDELQKVLRKEREMRSSLEKEVERLESAVSLWKQKYEELKEVTSKNRKEELLDLQHAYGRLSCQHQAKTAELTLANHRADQSAAKVKKLRYGVEELKQRLNQKEDKLDDVLNQIRKLQRSLDEQKEVNENLESELRHLQNRQL
ncbi:coiled-coil domain-containing protein 102B isoform X6 [Pipistrellus kuhlii]|uniref:coiled-coil domain-containing protein 102B isoform X6 n=1 Tax=Pipistrellus kuhlii TaxID=59472 RepID=UPI001E271A11|nr:coiled-coil domain-containing protein 102B isoform X6 [Pipistrellus kuhlii]